MSNLAKTFMCAQCGGVFEIAWSDEEAQAEREANGWKDIPDSEMAVVCENCYRDILPLAKGFSR